MRNLTGGGAWLVLPAVLLLAAFFLWPVGELVARSFRDPAGAWVHYQRIWEVPAYLRILNRTLVISAMTTVICVVLAYPLAYRLVTASPMGRAVILVCVLIPFWTNLLVRSYGWIIMLNPQGVINSALMGLGLIDEPLRLVYNTTGVLIGMSQIMLPFMILPIAAVMARLDPKVTHAARSLGATPVQAFFKVYLPLTMPGVMAGSVLVFTISLGFFVIPALLGGSREILLAQLIEFNINQVLNWGLAAALSTVLLIATLGLYWIGDRWFGLGRIWGLK
ncbi:MAG: ABC transporter permease [Rhodobacteraceae bacterium]|nr:ABC transporter permease [Paracoccaceae bacterium]